MYQMRPDNIGWNGGGQSAILLVGGRPFFGRELAAWDLLYESCPRIPF